MRVKSITQTHECSEKVNFDSVKELVEGYLADSREMVIETPQRTIRRDKKGFLFVATWLFWMMLYFRLQTILKW